MKNISKGIDNDGFLRYNKNVKRMKWKHTDVLKFPFYNITT